MTQTSKLVLILLLLCLVDTVTPFPILGVIPIYGVIEKPRWFQRRVREVYNRG